jgi:opacity protein-like surface antigen
MILNTKTLAYALASLLLAANTPLDAIAEDDFGRSGPYARIGFSGAFDGSAADSAGSERGLGVGASAGYRLNKWFAAEAQYNWFSPAAQEGGSTVERWDTTVNFRASLSGRFQPYVLVGLGYGRFKRTFESAPIAPVDAGGFGSRWGGGLDVYLTNHIVLYAEGSYMWLTGDVSEQGYGTLGAGAMWRF